MYKYFKALNVKRCKAYGYISVCVNGLCDMGHSSGWLQASPSLSLQTLGPSFIWDPRGGGYEDAEAITEGVLPSGGSRLINIIVINLAS